MNGTGGTGDDVGEGHRRYPSRPARKATIVCSVRDHAHHRSLVVDLVQRARRAGLAGATVFAGLEGYGTPGVLHAGRLLSEDNPVSIVVVDDPGRLDAFLEDNRERLAGVFVTVEDVEVLDLSRPTGGWR